MAETREPSNQRAPQPSADIDRIGATLRRAYDEAATEPLPEAFEDLLQQLK